jgi:hypothetical protein
MKGLKTIAAAAALAISGAAVAGPSYTFVDLGYLTGDSGNERTDGLGLRGSFGFAGLWHVAGEYSAVEAGGGKGKVTTTGNGIDVSGGNIYVGLHPAVTDNTDLVIDLGYDLLEADDGSTSGKTDVTSIFLRTGPRALLAGDKLELSAYVSLAVGETDSDRDGKDDFTNVGLQIGGQYYFTPAISLGVEAQVNGARSGPSGNTASLGNDDMVRIFGRWSFGRR